jgi:hypothetical protein
MTRTIKTPPIVKNALQKLPGVLIRSQRRTVWLKKYAVLSQKKSKKNDEDARTYFNKALW